MPSAFRDVIKELEGRFREVGLTLTELDDYGAALSGPDFSMRLSTERYYPAVVSASLLTSNSHRYEVGLLHEVLDPGKRESNRRESTEALETLGLRSFRTDDESAQKNLRLYLKMGLTQIIEFLIAKKSVILDKNESYREAYLTATREHLARHGLSGIPVE